METIGLLLALVSLAGFGVGLVSLVVPLRRLRIANRKQALGLLVGSTVLFVVGGSMLPSSSEETESQARSAAEIEPATEAPPSLSPSELLEADVATVLGDSNRDIGRLTGVEIQGNHIFINWTINNNLTARLMKTGARVDVRDVLQVLGATNVPFDTAQLIGSFSMVDRLGNATERTVVNATYASTTISQINFENFLFENSYEVADSAVIHPEFQ